jgi:hypothetical protein
MTRCHRRIRRFCMRRTATVSRSGTLVHSTDSPSW